MRTPVDGLPGEVAEGHEGEAAAPEVAVIAKEQTYRVATDGT
jgi:hypothetical protein